MRRTIPLKLVGCAAGLAMAIAGVATTATASASSSAGQPVPQNYLLCGYWSQTTNRQSGQSTVYHFSALATGEEYPYTGQTCEDQTTNGTFTPSSDMFSWDTTHANINTDPAKEFGTEHGLFTLTSNGGQPGGFNGRITDYDVNGFGGGDGILCTDNRVAFYSSGHHYDTACAEPGAPGNFNTHGGAQNDQHYRGTYGTILYQDDNNNECKIGSPDYCFETVLQGQTN